MRALAVLFLVAGAVHANGVLHAGGDVRLTQHRVKARLRDRLAEVAVEQVFENRSGRRLEGRYVFPLPDGATVSEFAMTMGGKMVEGEVLERAKARGIYEGIVNRKRDPGLLEKIDRGVFRARVFPIEPDAPLTIRIVYQQLLPENDGTIELRYPLARERMQAAFVEHVSFDAEIESSVDLKAVYSPVDGVTVEREGKRRARAEWKGGRGAQDRDFLLYVGRSPDAVGFSLLSHKPVAEKGTFLAVLAPAAEVKKPLPKDVIYILDTSGSMDGKKLQQAQRALAFGIRRLRPGDRFGVVAFSSGVERFRDGLVAADGAAREAAVDWVERLEANGGTALDEGLQAALAMTEEGRLSILALLTDGLPTVGERRGDIIAARVANANAARARVFVFGVGFDQDVPFLDRIAGTTRGAREYITPEQDLELVVSRFFRRIDQPVLTDLRIEIEPGVTELYPRALPDLFAGDQVVVAGRYEEAGPRLFRLHGKLQGGDVAYEYEGTLADRPDVASLPRLWAERKIAFLLDEIRQGGPDAELRDEVVRLGTKHSLVTPYTAGLVVEESEFVPLRRGRVYGLGNGPSTNSAIGLGAGESRGRGARRDMRAGGGSAKTESYVESGLAWLADNSWNGTRETAWALLAFLSAGYTDRGSARDNKYAKTVRDGLRGLITLQDADGRLGEPRAHAIATLALCEAYAMTRNPRCKRPAQQALDRIARSRDWTDASTTAYRAMALKSGKFAGFDIDPDAFERARRQLDKPASLRDASAALMAQIVMGASYVLELADRCAANPPDWSANFDGDYWSLGTLALFRVGGRHWKTWNEAMKRAILEDAQPQTLIERAQLILCLEVYYRY